MKLLLISMTFAVIALAFSIPKIIDHSAEYNSVMSKQTIDTNIIKEKNKFDRLLSRFDRELKRTINIKKKERQIKSSPSPNVPDSVQIISDSCGLTDSCIKTDTACTN